MLKKYRIKDLFVAEINNPLAYDKSDRRYHSLVIKKFNRYLDLHTMQFCIHQDQSNDVADITVSNLQPLSYYYDHEIKYVDAKELHELKHLIYAPIETQKISQKKTR